MFYLCALCYLYYDMLVIVICFNMFHFLTISEAHGNFNPLFDDNSSSTSQVRFRGVPQPPPKPTPAKPTSPKPSSPSLAHKGLPAPLGCDRQSFESRRYRDSLEGADFANKLSRFENLVHDRIKKPCASQISPRGYSSSQKKKLTGSPRVQRSLRSVHSQTLL